MSDKTSEKAGAVKKVTPLVGLHWKTADPFLFIAHHDDAYPKGNEKMGPQASLEGRNIGEDFEGIDGWRMYHGETVPGFPQHPHRGFETVTIARQGYIDHSDSLGATARFGQGDVQWLTAGKGINHSEMFPLVHSDKPNPAELFQIWVNLPKAGKMVAPYFSMQWADQIPKVTATDKAGRKTEVMLVAGELNGVKALPPPPDSWASKPESDLAIWTLKMAPKAQWTLPKAKKGTHRTLYFFNGKSMEIGGVKVTAKASVELEPEVEVLLENGDQEGELLLLQGRPIGEPVAQYGPFVMNTMAEIQQTFEDYRRTQFGGWHWETPDPVHPRTETRFAKHADGRIERP
ncbi:MAG TPA: pirin family protein [bacterium]|nr:pirin family protein [bacterium]